MKENFSERPNRSKKRIWIAAAAAGAVLIAGAVCAAALRSVNTPDTEDGEPVLMATATPSATVAGEEATPAAPAFSAVPLPTQTPEQYRVLSGLYYGDLDPTDSVYDKDSLLEYEYAENTVTLRDQEGNSVLKLELRENGRCCAARNTISYMGDASLTEAAFWNSMRTGGFLRSILQESVRRRNPYTATWRTGRLRKRKQYSADPAFRRMNMTKRDACSAILKNIRRAPPANTNTAATAGLRRRTIMTPRASCPMPAVYEYGPRAAVTITVTYYDENGAPTGMTREEEYDADGRLTRETYRSEKEQILTQTVYRYDAVGDLVVQEAYRGTPRPAYLQN